MNYEHGDVSQPLTPAQTKELLDKLQGKERLLCALALHTGININEAASLKAEQIMSPLVLNGRTLTSNPVLQESLLPFKAWSGHIFKASPEYMQRVVLKLTKEKLGTARSYQALRRTYVINCAKSCVPLEKCIESTGEKAGTIYAYYRLVRHNGNGHP